MEIQDGFITGIFNYCDRWCETCAFTSRCRVFADMAETEGALDPTFKAIVDAPPLPEDLPPEPPKWLQELIEEMNAAASAPVSAAEIECSRPRLAPEHESIHVRAHAYCDRVHGWLRARDYFPVENPNDARAVIGWFHTLIPAKIFRALTGLARDVPEERDWPADHDGSAKVALLGIDRSHAAWLQLVDRGLASHSDVEPHIADLVWLGEKLERVFPRARAFVRPAFDEPDEVSKLLALDGGQ
jgi:hypothetical protein